MNIIRLRGYTALVSVLSAGLHAATPVQLQPFLEYSPIQSMVGQVAGTGGMSHAVLVMDLTSESTGQQRPAIIVSEYGNSLNSVVAFDGASGSPLPGWTPGNVKPANSVGYAYLSGSSLPYPRVIAAFSNKPTLVVSEYGKIISQFSLANSHSSALSIGGAALFTRRELRTVMYGGEDYKIHKVSLSNYQESTGWPKTHTTGGQRVTTPALLDINNDLVPEAFSVSGSGNFEVRAHDGLTGDLLWARQFDAGYAANYLAIGQVNADLSREVVLVHRQLLSPFSPIVTVMDANSGVIEQSALLSGSISYGSAPALADFNGDGLDDVVVITESMLNVLNGANFAQLAGFPRTLGNIWVGDSAPVIGDIGGDPGKEIVFTTQVPGSFAQSMVHIINQNGTYMFPPQSMELGGGRTNAIHDLDGDGHNELVIAARGAPSVGNQQSVWVFDFSRNEPAPTVHGAVSWGQFGQNAERCNCSKLSLQ